MILLMKNKLMFIFTISQPNIPSLDFVNQKHSTNELIKNTLSQKYFWPQYEWNQKNYLKIGLTKPKTGEHRNNHRLSLWLNLIPRLLINDETNMADANYSGIRKKYQLFQNLYNNNYNVYGQNNIVPLYSNERDKNILAETSKHISDTIPISNTPMASEPYSSQHQQKQIYRQHHLLVDYDNLNSYDGIVRTYSNVTETTANNIKSINLNSSLSNKSSGTDAGTLAVVNLNPTLSTLSNWNVTHSSVNTTKVLDDMSNQILKSRYDANIFHYNNGSAKWLIIIGIVCVILFCINVTFFIALFYQLKKNRKYSLENTTIKQREKKRIEVILYN